jgi:hypothetical protein
MLEYPVTEIQRWAHTRLRQLLAREVGFGGNNELLSHLGQRLGRIERSGVLPRRRFGGKGGLGGLYSHGADGGSGRDTTATKQVSAHRKTELRDADRL